MATFKLIDINQHCFDLSKFFFQQSISGIDILTSKNISYWLHLASGVERVMFSVESLDHTNGIVEDLYRPLYEEESKHISQVINATTRFNHVWAGLELLMDSISKTEGSRDDNRLAAFCRRLKEYYEPQKNLILHNYQIRDLKKYFRKISLFEKKQLTGKIFKVEEKIGRSAKGIYLVNKIKPYFAYGSFQVPVATRGFGEKPIDPRVVTISSRIVLLSIQMFLLTLFNSCNEKIDCYWYKPEHRRKLSIQTFLRIVHLKLNFE
jgi:hypothetical protein